jgi:HAD superfamily hydrolase (TIGR01484 family)
MKIFFSDLDGTLLNDRKKIDDRTRSALERFIEAGNAFAVSTGRAMDSAMMVRDELELFYPRTFLIGYNGAQIYDCARNETIRRVCLDRRLVKQAFQQRRKMLRVSLRGILPENHPFSTQRPEQLSIEEFIQLTNDVEKQV